MVLPVKLAAPREVEGVQLVTCAAGIKADSSPDLVIAKLAENTQCAAVFTKNSFCAAPVTICREQLLDNGGAVRALLINSGNANAGTGKPGYQMARGHCDALAEALAVPSNSVLPFSTGVIGQLLPDQAMREAIGQAVEQMDVKAQVADWQAAASGIMTTDTQLKLTSRTCQVQQETITITGMVKGSGMIQPNMATLLSFIFTDAAISAGDLDSALCEAVEHSFNAITIDSDTSTNDSCVLMATACGKSIKRDGEGWSEFTQALAELLLDLAKAVVKDAEGASKFISVSVQGGRSIEECKEVGYAVANSPLVKTAMFASDANVGRLLMAIGKANVVDLDPTQVRVSLGDVLAFESAGIASSYTDEKGMKVLAAEEIDLLIELGRGDADAMIYTSDLSHDYVSINADYRS